MSRTEYTQGVYFIGKSWGDGTVLLVSFREGKQLKEPQKEIIRERKDQVWIGSRMKEERTNKQR